MMAPTAGPLSKDLVTSQVPTSSLALSFFSSLSSARTPAVRATATAAATVSRSAFILLSLSERGSGLPVAGLRTWASAWPVAFRAEAGSLPSGRWFPPDGGGSERQSNCLEATQVRCQLLWSSNPVVKKPAAVTAAANSSSISFFTPASPIAEHPAQQRRPRWEPVNSEKPASRPPAAAAGGSAKPHGFFLLNTINASSFSLLVANLVGRFSALPPFSKQTFNLSPLTS